MVKIYYNDKGIQLGNLLYLCLQVYKDRKAGQEAYVLRNGWYKQASIMFPNLAPFFSKANGRMLTFIPESYFQKHGQDFTSLDLDSFCEEVLLPNIDSRISHIEKKDLVICIRRGDMYSPEQRNKYAFDIIKYVNTALEGQYPKQSVRIVSDDIDWCKAKLNLNKFQDIEFSTTDRVDNFWQMLQTNKTLIIPNSTFAYWAAYLLRVKNNKVKIIAPNFNTYLLDNGKQIADTRAWNLIDVDTALSKLKVGVFYVATGNYTQFFDDFYKTAKEKLLTDSKVTYYVYTDKLEYFEKYRANGDLVLSLVEHKPFPYPTLFRYHFFSNNKEIWQQEDYMIFFNANTVFKEKVGYELIPTKESLKCWSLPVYNNKTYEYLPFEKRQESAAYIPYQVNKQYTYVQGGFIAAYSPLFKLLVEYMKKLTDIDQAKGITPVWNDESYLNKLVNTNVFQVSLLSQSLYLPEEYGIESKVVLLDKKTRGGHENLRFK